MRVSPFAKYEPIGTTKGECAQRAMLAFLLPTTYSLTKASARRTITTISSGSYNVGETQDAPRKVIESLSTAFFSLIIPAWTSRILIPG